MSDFSPLKTSAIKYNKPKIQFFYQNTPTPTRVNKENNQYSNISPLNIPKDNSSQSIVQDQKKYSYSCFACGKQATHKAVLSCKNYCTPCSIGQMMKGFELLQIGKQLVQKVNKTSIGKPLQPKQPARQIQLEMFLKELETEEKKIKGLLEESQKNQEIVKKNYQDKKQQAISYYQKIQKAIKLSLKQDMQLLQSMEKLQISSICQPRQSLTQDIKKINGIKSDIKPNIQKIVQKVEEAKYLQFMENYRSLVAHISNDSKEISKKNHKHSINTSFEQKSNFFDPSFYRVFQNEDSTTIESSEEYNGIFFSFDKKKS